MDGSKFAKTKYLEYYTTHPRISDKSADVWLVESPNFLTLVRRSDGSVMEHIPWEHIREIGIASMRKSGLASLGTSLNWALGGFDTGYHDGVSVVYRDDEVERDLTVFFKTGSKRSSEKLIRVLWQKRDYWIRQSGLAGNLRR